MKSNYSRIKEDKICNICLKKTEKLSKDHVPPQCCPPVKTREVSSLLFKMIINQEEEKSKRKGKGRGFQPDFVQNGIVFETICRECNSFLGLNYDPHLGNLSSQIQSFVNSRLHLPSSFELECYPNAIIRSILGHLLAAKTRTDQCVVDSVIRPCVLDSSLPVPDDIHVFYWVYPYDTTVIIRDFIMPSIRGRISPDLITAFSLIKFYPLGFLIAHKLDKYENLESLHKFNAVSVKDKGKITINLDQRKPYNWPVNCKDSENFLLFGRAANDSIFSTSRHHKNKKK